MIKKLANGELDITLLEIKDVIDIKVLQKFQDNFSTSMNIATITSDKDGHPITKPSCFTSFCMEYTHSTKTGDSRCASSRKKGAQEALRTGKPSVYTCHAGLTDFLAPILILASWLAYVLSLGARLKATSESTCGKVKSNTAERL